MLINLSSKKSIESIASLKEIIEKNLSTSTSKLLEIILKGAIDLNSSDLHFEAQKTKVRLRLRIDGILQEVLGLDLNIYKSILSRLKLISKVKLNIANLPQAGRFTISIEESQIEIRMSTLPTEYGESIVLRILNPEKLISLDKLGLRKDFLELFKKEIKKPNGMIIITGPTGSGKTTTLYAFLKTIHGSGKKIITIEDPIEYHLNGISQTQTNPTKGYDFASGLKAIMRQDPDIILVGEIRDSQTSKIALQAALTGHLVFTTLHTNDAAGTVARLVSLQANPVNIGPAINLIIAQRLVRNVCKKCRVPKKISDMEMKKIKKKLKGIPFPSSPTIFKAKGCKYCNFTGYSGRTGIFEALVVDEEIEKFILKNQSIAALRKEALRKGLTTIQQDGLIKALQGATTLEEVERVTGL